MMISEPMLTPKEYLDLEIQKLKERELILRIMKRYKVNFKEAESSLSVMRQAASTIAEQTQMQPEMIERYQNFIFQPIFPRMTQMEIVK